MSLVAKIVLDVELRDYLQAGHKIFLNIVKEFHLFNVVIYAKICR